MSDTPLTPLSEEQLSGMEFLVGAAPGSQVLIGKSKAISLIAEVRRYRASSQADAVREAREKLLLAMAIAYDLDHVGACEPDDVNPECAACKAEAEMWAVFRGVAFGSTAERSRAAPSAMATLASRAALTPSPARDNQLPKEKGVEALRAELAQQKKFGIDRLNQHLEEEQAAHAENTRQRMRYLGVLGLLCEGAVYWPNGMDGDELRETLETALKDACSDGRLEWRRVINRFEIWPVDAPPSPAQHQSQSLNSTDEDRNGR